MATKTTTKKFTDDELQEWAEAQKRDYAAGKLTPSQIRKLEAIQGWKWEKKQTLKAVDT